MEPLEHAFCPNESCTEYGLRGQGNVSVRGRYGKNKDRVLLYCKTCKARFAETTGTPLFGLHLSKQTVRAIVHHAAEGVGVRATARLLGVSKDTVNRVIVRVGEHVERVLGSLLASLSLTEAQLDELWTFVKKRRARAKRI